MLRRSLACTENKKPYIFYDGPPFATGLSHHEVDADAWATLHSDTSRPFPKPATGRIAVKVINHLGDEVMKVFGV